MLCNGLYIIVRIFYLVFERTEETQTGRDRVEKGAAGTEKDHATRFEAQLGYMSGMLSTWPQALTDNHFWWCSNP